MATTGGAGASPAAGQRFEQQEFVRCQGINLLGRLPAAARGWVRYYEVAALLQPFRPLPPLAGPAKMPAKRFVYVVVTDWSLFLITMGSKSDAEESVVLEVPCLGIRDLARRLRARRRRPRRALCSRLVAALPAASHSNLSRSLPPPAADSPPRGRLSLAFLSSPPHKNRTSATRRRMSATSAATACNAAPSASFPMSTGPAFRAM